MSRRWTKEELNQLAELANELNSNNVTVERRDHEDWVVSATGRGPMRMMVPLAATDTQDRAVFLKECFDPSSLAAMLRQAASDAETLETLRGKVLDVADELGMRHWEECECDLPGEDSTCRSKSRQSARKLRALLDPPSDAGTGQTKESA